jgi:hypothetical protein
MLFGHRRKHRLDASEASQGEVAMESFVDVLVGLRSSLLLILLVAAHILEEVVKGFRRFFNLEWFQTGRDDFPTSKRKALRVDQLGLFVMLSLLALAGARWPPALYVAVGFISADVVQHAIFSLVRGRYTPGVATSALYLAFVVHVVRQVEAFDACVLGAMAVGAAALLANYATASFKVRRSRA